VPTLRWVELQIERVEGFAVEFHHRDGRDVRSDMQDIPSYPYNRKLSDNRTVREWKHIRFRVPYRGFDVHVLHADGTAAHGRTLLRTLRAERDQ
jgi:hypothetical protein